MTSPFGIGYGFSGDGLQRPILRLVNRRIQEMAKSTIQAKDWNATDDHGNLKIAKATDEELAMAQAILAKHPTFVAKQVEFKPVAFGTGRYGVMATVTLPETFGTDSDGNPFTVTSTWTNPKSPVADPSNPSRLSVAMHYLAEARKADGIVDRVTPEVAAKAAAKWTPEERAAMRAALEEADEEE